MIMRHHRQFLNCHVLGQRGGDFVNEFSADRPDTSAAKNLAGLWISQQLHKAVLRFHDERFAVVVERITCRQA